MRRPTVVSRRIALSVNELNSGSMLQLIENETPADVDAVSATSLLRSLVNVDASCDTSLIGVRNFRSDHSDIAVVNNECNIDKRSTTSVENARVKIQKLQALQPETDEKAKVNAHRDAGMDESVDSAVQVDYEVNEEFDNASERWKTKAIWGIFSMDLADRKGKKDSRIVSICSESTNAGRAGEKQQRPSTGECVRKFTNRGLWVYYGDTSRRYKGRSPKLEENVHWVHFL